MGGLAATAAKCFLHSGSQLDGTLPTGPAEAPGHATQDAPLLFMPAGPAHFSERQHEAGGPRADWIYTG